MWYNCGMKVVNSIFKSIIAVFLMVVIAVAYLPFCLLFPIKIHGKKNLKVIKGGAVVACNHFSNLDPIVLKVRLFFNGFTNSFLGKIEVNKFKPVGWFLSCFGIIYIDRAKIDRNAMREVDKALKKGKKVIVFPEGTRNKTGSTDLQAVKSGVVFFAKKASVPILPIRINKKPRLFRMTHIYIGEAYNTGDSGELSTAEEVCRLEGKMNSLIK